MIELGGNIKLDGFESVEPALLVVIKKIVGNFTKQYSEKTEVSELLIVLEDKENSKVSGRLNGDINESANGDNLFYSLNEVLIGIKNKLS